MSRFIVLPVIIFLLILSACSTAPEETDQENDVPQETESPAWDVVENEDAPDWVKAWLAGGNQAVENIEAYRDRYVFVRSGEGDNFDALGQWAAGFAVEHDFAPLAAERIERRLYRGTNNNPDAYYGSFFSILMRRAYDKDYPGAEKIETFWLTVRRRAAPAQSETEGAEGAPAETAAAQNDSWLFLILTGIDRTIFQNQVRSMFGYMNLIPVPTAAQQKAIDRVTGHFFDGF